MDVPVPDVEHDRGEPEEDGDEKREEHGHLAVLSTRPEDGARQHATFAGDELGALARVAWSRRRAADRPDVQDRDEREPLLEADAHGGRRRSSVLPRG